MACLESYSQCTAELGLRSLILSPPSPPVYMKKTPTCALNSPPYRESHISMRVSRGAFFFFLVAHVCGWEERPVSPTLLGY